MPKHTKHDRSVENDESTIIKKHKKEKSEVSSTKRSMHTASSCSPTRQESHKHKHSVKHDGRERSTKHYTSPKRKKLSPQHSRRGDRHDKISSPKREKNLPHRDRHDKINPPKREKTFPHRDRHEQRNEQRRDNVHIKREEDFDRRQEALSQKRSDEKKVPEKEKPNLGLSGALTEDTNTFRGVVIKYNEPPEARIPKKKWRLYQFKGTESLKTLHLHRQSAYLLGRQRRIADIPIDHPSCSKQHAVLQFRMVEEEDGGVLRRKIKPYIIDLEAANGTYVNNERIEAQRYVELKETDVIKFGFSSREYVLLHGNSNTSAISEESEETED